MKFETITQIVAKMGAMRFFPSDVDSRLAIAEGIAEMTGDEKQARWLVKRALALYAEWPGIRELRACFCSRYRPKDGFEVDSAVYLDGIPGEKESFPALAPAPPRQLAAGEPASASEPLAALVIHLAAVKVFPAVKPLTLRDGESEYNALARSSAQYAEPAPPRWPAAAEIEAIKRRQAERAEHEETRAILAGGIVEAAV